MPAVTRDSVIEPGPRERSKLRLGLQLYVGCLVALYFAILFVWADEVARLIGHIWVFAPSGIIAAIIANSTGTGGGVVFVPAFSALSGASELGRIPLKIALEPANTIAISFLIQCFGMSVGASVWLDRFYGGGSYAPGEKIAGRSFVRIVLSVLITALPTMLLTQFALFATLDGKLLIAAFKWSSLVLGAVLLFFTWRLKHLHPRRFEPESQDIYWIVGLGAIGGVITAYFSVGVGELVVVYLLMRGFPTTAAIAAAVVITATTVIGGVGFHILEGNIIWPVALVAIPGAMIGGFIARLFATWLGPLWLKTFAAVWILASSAFLIVAPYADWLPS